MYGRFTNALLGLLAVLSLGAASVSACTCSHHREVKAQGSACHGHSEMPDMDGASGEAGAEQASCVDDADCICAANACRTSVKAKGPKLSHQPAILASVIGARFPTAVAVTLTPRIDFEPPSYLTDSFYNLSPKRGPPVT